MGAGAQGAECCLVSMCSGFGHSHRKTAQSVKTLTVKPDDLSLSPGPIWHHAVLASLHSDCSIREQSTTDKNVCGGGRGTTAKEGKTHNVIWGVESTMTSNREGTKEEEDMQGDSVTHSESRVT